MIIGKLLLQLIGRSMQNGEDKNLRGVIFDRTENTIFDIPYSKTDDERLKFDLLKASGDKRKDALIINIHGGAYYHGHRINNYQVADYFRAAGYDVAVADYRLTSVKEGRSVETEVRDLLECVYYLQDHLGDYGLENDKIIIMGDSAGGHFALLLSEILQDGELQNKWGVGVFSKKISATVVSCPVYDFAISVYWSGLSKSGRDYMYGKGWEDEEWTKKLDSRLYIKSLKAPVFISSCENDFLKEHSFLLNSDLKTIGLEHEFCFIGNKDKKVSHVHNIINLSLPDSKAVNEAAIRFLETKA